ncbi:hypothetical protein ACFODO_15310 [Acinetobacter sichuanensis]|uniref:Uncharacterized protein n=1 Tax=Acinetobacter sichuanensis TaxID=2136183 RepID=A0A371YVP5_9GAMM|nr:MULTISPECIES: hypothetical protein [Acinetobacter]MDM1763678.1 hypothetical protein [Acinetobacter sp. 226-1]MDM1767157.1 hypothetical protein [Acinetobacter sp. 226-4]MDQ9019936.1 hypothetical protein [Acinetobacter sichuanensis]RFC85484.1 hypothetical protein C9E89_000760 [Acinetobacter sichuanensis]
MKEEVKIAIFGLSLNVLESLKQKIQALYDGSIQISWANIADPQLDILLVNDMFFGSPTIQNLVGNQKVAYLRLVNKQDKSGLIEDDALYLPFTASDEIRNWFKARYHGEPIRQQNLKSSTLKNVQPLEIKKLIKELFDPRNSNIQVFDNTGNIALINIRKEQVWADPERRTNNTDTSLNFTYATMQKVQSVDSIQGQDLKNWLWNLLWYSPQLLEDHNVNTFYKLKFWPQPQSAYERQSIFKIAACFEKGASISQIEKKLEIKQSIIQHFVSVAVLTNALQEINETDAKLIVKSEKTEGVLKGFFGKLRRKLGL